METMFFRLQDLVIKVVNFGHSSRVVWNGYGLDFKNVHAAIAFVEARGGQLIIDKWE